MSITLMSCNDNKFDVNMFDVTQCQQVWCQQDYAGAAHGLEQDRQDLSGGKAWKDLSGDACCWHIHTDSTIS